MSVCLSVYLHDISKTEAARITKRDIENVRIWVLEIYLFWGQKVNGQGHESQNIAGVGVCTLVSADFF